MMNMKKLSTFVLMAASTVAVYAQTLQDGLQALDFDQFEKARNIFTTLTQQEPTNGANFYYLGQAQWRLFKPELAKAAYEKGVMAAPTNPMNYAGLGELALDNEDTTKARTYFNKALSFNVGRDGSYKDKDALRFVAASMVSAEAKMTNDAVKLIERAMEIDKKDYEVLITAGDVYLEKNEGGKAATMYENAISYQKNNPKAYTRVSGIWLRVKNAEATKTELDRALAIDSNYAPALKNLAEFYSLSKQYAKAKETYQRYLVNSEPSNANKARFARILFRNKEYADVLSVVTDLQKTDQSDLYLFRLSGYSYYEVGAETKDTTKMKPGIEALEYFIAKVDPSKVISNDYEYLSKLYSRLADQDSMTLYYLDKALALDPNKIELLKEAGTICNKLRRFDLSIPYFEQFIARSPNPSLVDYYALGMAAYYGKEFGKCDSAFAKILETKPDYADGYFWRAVANASMDPEYKTTAAKDFWEQYLTLTEATPEKYKRNLSYTYDGLANYYIQKDNNAKAKEYYNKYLTLNPTDERVKGILKQLK
jgi:tetratricopeptide (TPR) repeat protein